MTFPSALAVSALCAFLLVSSASGRRHLFQTQITDPAVLDAVSASRNATYAAHALLALGAADAEEPSLTIQRTADLFLVGHAGADAVDGAAAVGQISSAVAAAEASVATAIATVAALNKSEDYISQAQAAIQAAEAATAAITQEDNSTLSAARNASLTLLPRIAHDGSLVLYWANETNNVPQDAEVFNETVYFAAGVEDDAPTQTVLTSVPEALTAGANPGLALSLLHVVLHEMFGAIYTYQGDWSNVYAEQVEASNAVSKAARILASNPTVDAATVNPLLEAARPALQTGLDTANAVASGAPDAATRVTALLTALQELDGQVEAAEGAIQTPAPAPTASPTANAGR